jgi:ferredoxin
MGNDVVKGKEPMATKIRADREKCVGAGTCVVLVPTIFDQGDNDAIVELLKHDVAESERAAVEEAVEFCPAQAIWLEQPPD